VRWRGFFLTCTFISVFFSAALLGALPSTPDQPPEVAAGFALWQSNGCVGCHTIYGQGGAYAPDLTHIYSQRGENYLREFFVHPEAYHPDQRLMPRFGLTRTETDVLLAFLDAVDDMNTASAFRPVTVSGMGGVSAQTVASDTSTTTAAEEDPAVARGRALFSRAPAICSTCHSLERDVVIVGPSLYGIADRAWYRIPGQSPEQYIRNSILYPDEYIVEGYSDVMQKNFADSLSSDSLNDLIAFLMTLEDENAG
jgi:cytochrome c2